MSAAAPPLSPELRALARELAYSLGLVLVGLAARIAGALWQHPSYAGLITPLWNRLHRTARRVTNLMTTLADGRLPVQYPSQGRPGGRFPKPPIPTSRAWLHLALRDQVATYRTLLTVLLTEPGMSELLAAAPTIQRLLNPILHALGMDAARAYSPRPRAAPPKPPEPTPAPTSIEHRRLYPSGEAPPFWREAPPPSNRPPFKPA